MVLFILSLKGFSFILRLLLLTSLFCDFISLFRAATVCQPFLVLLADPSSCKVRCNGNRNLCKFQFVLGTP